MHSLNSLYRSETSAGGDVSRAPGAVALAAGPESLQHLTRLQTENTVLRDRLLLAEGALESLRVHGEQERSAREAMHATLVASENSRALLRAELVQGRAIQAELEMERVELQRKVAELEETSHLRAHRSTSGGR